MPPATDNVRDTDRELLAITQAIEFLTEKKDDAKWAGDAEKVNTVNYQIMLKKTIRAMLIKRRKQIGKQNGGG